jgi:hypothetical protein
MTKKSGIASVLVATIVTVMTLYVVSTVHMIVKFEQRRNMQVDETQIIYRTKINTISKFNKEEKKISASRRDKDDPAHIPPREMASTTNPIYFLHIGKVRINYSIKSSPSNYWLSCRIVQIEITPYAM